MHRIRIIVAGCAGGRGYWFAEELSRNAEFEIVALVDLMTDAARLVGESLGLPGVPVFSQTSDALAQVSCDALLVATPDAEHMQPALQALSLGKHVYVEKPLSITLTDCMSLIRAARAAGGRTMVGFNLRFAPMYRRIHQLIAEGRIGRLLTIEANEHYHGGKTYFRRWNRLRSQGGGLWITKACHDFDLLYWLSGSLPRQVMASARLSHYVRRPEAGDRCSRCPVEPTCADSNLKELESSSALVKSIRDCRAAVGWPPADMCLFNSDKDTFDHGTAQVVFENEVIASYALTVVAAFTERRMVVAGTEGTVEGSLGKSDLLFWPRRIPESEPERIPVSDPDTEAGGHGGGDARLLADFAALVRGQPSAAVGPTGASVAVALGVAATVSSDSETGVRMESLPAWAELRQLLA